MTTFNNSPLDNTQFINAVNIADFLLNLLNMQLNVTADDLETHSNRILEEIHQHLNEQDERLERIEAMFQERGTGRKRRYKNGT